eukprot:48288-Prorocentrum_minimum.AAC.1
MSQKSAHSFTCNPYETPLFELSLGMHSNKVFKGAPNWNIAEEGDLPDDPEVVYGAQGPNYRAAGRTSLPKTLSLNS